MGEPIDKAAVRPSPEVAAIRARARGVAAELGHVEPMLEHWLLAVVDDERGHAVLVAAGAEIEALRAKLVRALPPGLVFNKPKKRFLSPLREMFAAIGKPEITLADLFQYMLLQRREPGGRGLLASFVEPLDVRNFLAHGIRKPAPRSRLRELVTLPRAWLVRAPAPVTAALWNVVAHDDDFTPVAVAVSLLVRFFAKTSDDAQALAVRISADGSAVVGTYSHKVAMKKAHKATLEAHADSFPLRFSLEPVD